MGYTAVKDISANILPEFLSYIEEEDEDDKFECAVEEDGYCYSAAFHPAPLTKTECLTLSSYGVQTCYSDNDYYAGAVKQCKGVSNLREPTLLYQVYPHIYLNESVIAKLGMTLNEEGGGTIWSVGPDPEGNKAYVTYFARVKGKDYYTNGHVHEYRTDSDTWAICCRDLDEEPEPVEYAKTLCEEIEKTYNIKESNCTVPAADASGRDFSEITPHIILSNGLRLYIGSEYEEIDDLSDSTDAEDKEGFIIYIDVNGTTGKGKLYEDVFPYILLKSGKVVPAYEADNNSGGTNKEHLSINVLYETYNNGGRQVNLLLRDANFRKAACTTGYVTSKKYCGSNNVQYNVCKKEYHDCRLIINRPIKMF